MSKRENGRRLVLAIALLMLAFAAKGWLVEPPRVPASVAAGAFDTTRAMARLQRILANQRPHPVDSVANDAVRGRLIAELSAIGLDPQVREADDCRADTRARVVSCSHVHNVVASVGPASGKRLLLNAHYDSTPTGPGAADDGIGVATLIEVAAQLKADPPLRGVTFLFNEGEEYGLNGASAFARRDPLAGQVDSMINIESRGVSGPATMFETSAPNGPTLADYAAATKRPSANSISTDMATLIPNTTDVQVLKANGWRTLSYAIIGNETRYHSPSDTVAALDRRSVAQMGSEVLAATRAMAADRGDTATSRKVFTDVAGLFLLSLPVMVAAVLLGLLLVAVLVIAWRRKALGRPLLVVAGAWVGSSVAAALVVTVLGLLRPGAYWNAWPLIAYLAVYAVVLAVEGVLLARLGGVIGRNRLRAAAWSLTLLLGAAASLVLPGATIFFLLAPVVALVGLLVEHRSARAAAILFGVAALLQLLMFAQLLALTEMLLVDGPLWAVAPLAALAALPVLVEVSGPIGRPVRLLLGGLALLACLAALAIPRTSGLRPGALTVDYLRDDIAKRADWSVSNGQSPLPDGWDKFGPWRQATLRNSKSKRWLAAAPMLALPMPAATVTASVPDGTGRRVTIRLDRGGFNSIGVRFAKEVRVTAMGLPGQTEPFAKSAGKGSTLLRCSGRRCDGLEVELSFADRRPVVAELIGTAFALPPQGAPLVVARPVGTIPHYAPNSSVRIVPLKL